jgi:hypothetical protein
VLHHELIYRDRRYQRARLTISHEDDDIMTISDIAVVNNFAVSLDNGWHNFGLNIMGLFWSLKEYSFSHRTWPRRTPKSGSQGWKTRKN